MIHCAIKLVITKSLFQVHAFNCFDPLKTATVDDETQRLHTEANRERVNDVF